MYAHFFGLRHEPFSIAPDPRYLFMSERHREALAHLLYGLSGGGGFVLLTGEIGAGKTTVCRLFLEQIPASCNVAYIFNPKLTVTELLQTVCDEFHVALPEAPAQPRTVKTFVDALNAFLLHSHAQGKNNVLIIDEAQNLSAEVLEQLRLLTNLETSERKLLQIVLIGQPELRGMVGQPELEQLAQRVIARYHLGALNESETARYVQHRLDVAGLERPAPFSRDVLRRVHQIARGVPRRINLLCDRALLGAYARGQASVTRRMVDEAGAEVFGPDLGRPRRSHGRWLAWTAGALSGAAALGFAGAVALGWTPGVEALRSVTSLTRGPAAATEPAREALVAGGSGDAAAPAPEGARSVMAPARGDARPVAPGDAEPGSRPSLLRSQEAAWRELAREWKVDAPTAGPACPALAREGVFCFSRSMGLPLIRQLGRPGIVTLDARTDAPSYALLVAVTDRTATLRAAGAEQTVTLSALAARWQGDFATLWRAPKGYAGRAADLERGPAFDWAARQLAAPPDAPARPLRERIRAFQVAQGLPATGALSPLTFMQLNRAAGVDEPRLRAQP